MIIISIYFLLSPSAHAIREYSKPRKLYPEDRIVSLSVERIGYTKGSV